MDLQFIKTTACPIRGDSRVINESVEMNSFNNEVRAHVNGGHWEKRTFACGQQMEYIPNFNDDRLSNYHICKNDPNLIEKKRLRQEAVDQTQAFIKTLNVDDNFKERLLHEV